MIRVRDSGDSGIANLVEGVNASGGTYHRLDLGDGLVVEGTYDMGRHLDKYRIPDDLGGKTVLDVGTSSGFFAMECASRGAAVTAIDIWDEPFAAQLFAFVEGDIRYVKRDLYTLDESFGTFDLVICGSVLLHLPDPVGAFRALRRVSADRLVVSTSRVAEGADDPRPLCNFDGLRGTDGDYWAYWSMNAAALLRMAQVAGFSQVDHVDQFELVSEPGMESFAVPHVVVGVSV